MISVCAIWYLLSCLVAISCQYFSVWSFCTHVFNILSLGILSKLNPNMVLQTLFKIIEQESEKISCTRTLIDQVKSLVHPITLNLSIHSWLVLLKVLCSSNVFQHGRSQTQIHLTSERLDGKSTVSLKGQCEIKSSLNS